MSIVNIFTTARGSHQAVDPHGFRYHLNRKLDKVTYWRCTKKDCSVRIISRNSSSKLVGETPHHEHTTNILKQQAKSVEKNIIKKYAALPGTGTKAMLCEISQNILRSDQPNALYSMSSTGATKMALFREKQKLNPLPPLPKTYKDVLTAVIPHLPHPHGGSHRVHGAQVLDQRHRAGGDHGVPVGCGRRRVAQVSGLDDGRHFQYSSRSLLSGNHHIISI